MSADERTLAIANIAECIGYYAAALLLLLQALPSLPLQRTETLFRTCTLVASVCA